MESYRIFIMLAGINGLLATLFGAFGSHALKNRLSEYALSVFQIANQYQFYHAFGLALVGILLLLRPELSLLRWSGWLMLAGIIIFSGSLYILALSGIKVLGAITPIGGICFIMAWCLMAYAMVKMPAIIN